MNEWVEIHADDFGYSLRTSMDMLDCMREGKLDSFSIICNTKWFDESMDLFYSQIPSLPFLPLISIHINLPEGYCDGPVLPMSWGKLLLSSYSPNRKRIKNELKKEINKQIRKTQSAIDKCIMIAKENGITVKQKGMRIDSHVHTHLIPVVWESLIEVLEENDYQIEYIRNPKEPLLPFLSHFSLLTSYGLINIIKNRILMLYSGKVDRFCEKNRIDKMYMWGLMMSGHMDIDRIQKIYPSMIGKAKNDERKLELLFHPGKTEDDEYSSEMNPDFFREFNSSENRRVEMNAVMNLDRSDM